MVREVDYAIIACSYGSSSFPCFNIKKSINNLMTTNQWWFTIFLDFKVTSIRLLFNCPFKLEVEVKVDMSASFVALVKEPICYIFMCIVTYAVWVIPFELNSPRYDCSYSKTLFLGYTGCVPFGKSGFSVQNETWNLKYVFSCLVPSPPRILRTKWWAFEGWQFSIIHFSKQIKMEHNDGAHYWSLEGEVS